MGVRRVADLDFASVAGPLTASPSAWEDEVLYFLLVDRFSDGREDGVRDLDGTPAAGTTPMYRPGDNGNAITTESDAARWRQAGVSWVGGTLAGVRGKLGYLARLGVTALWISPVLRQVKTPEGAVANYHGYATQDFLSVEPKFGSDEDLRELVAAAHAAGLRVILDVVLNHAGDVFAYETADPRWTGREYPVAGWRDGAGGLAPFTPQAAEGLWPDGAVFPAELHAPGTFSRRGRIDHWDLYPAEYIEGDFFGLKDIAHGSGELDVYQPSPALVALTRAYCWWIAFADLDGFRVDTVKHMDRGATRYFAAVVHEFAQSVGKDRFFLVGEITGSRGDAVQTMQLTGLDAALGLADVQYLLDATATGRADPAGYFALFRNSALIGKDSHTWLRNTVVTSYDDHDQVRKGDNKARFCAEPDGPALALAVLALNATTLGIPCVYYGSEQALDGRGSGEGADRYLREAMFGREFGPFRSRGRHVFDEDHPLYQGLAALLALRGREPALRRGRQYLREISGDGVHFGLPTGFGDRVRSIVAWSRILADRELLCAINTDPATPQTAWVTIDAGLHREGDQLTCLHHTQPGPHAPLPVTSHNGKAVLLTLPPGGFAVHG
jgi:glycosidase